MSRQSDDAPTTRRYRPCHRITVYVVAVADTEDEVSAKFEAIMDAVDQIPGAFCQGGGTVRMPHDDVVCGSPLDMARQIVLTRPDEKQIKRWDTSTSVADPAAAERIRRGASNARDA